MVKSLKVQGTEALLARWPAELTKAIRRHEINRKCLLNGTHRLIVQQNYICGKLVLHAEWIRVRGEAAGRSAAETSVLSGTTAA